jgi:DNA modification methylase
MTWIDDGDVQLYHGDAIDVLKALPAAAAQTCVTSPPYWGLRDYGTGDGQIGLEATPELYVERMVAVFREVWRVLRGDGSVWLNLGDSYANDLKWGGSSGGKHVMDGQTGEEGYRIRRETGLKPKDLVGIPWRVAFALQADGWYLRSDIIWSKPNPMPESVTDRPTKAHEYLFLLSKRPRYFYDADAIREPHTGGTHGGAHAPGMVNGAKIAATQNGGVESSRLGLNLSDPAGRNRRSVWTIPTEPFPEAHFATYPQALVRPCILAGSAVGDTVLDPFIGSGTTALVARKHGRRCIGIDLSAEYLGIAARRLQQLSLFADGRGHSEDTVVA